MNYDWRFAIGIVGSLLTFTAFFVKTMIPLRVAAICANVTTLTYALMMGLVPVAGLHMALLPLNVYRLMQMRRLTREIKNSTMSGFSIEGLAPFMTRERLKPGDELFHAGDKAHKLYFLVRGTLQLVEIGRTIPEGEMFGEIGLFSPDGIRTATARAGTDVELLSLTEDRVIQLYYQNPKFGFYAVRMICQHLLHDLQAAAAARSKAG